MSGALLKTPLRQVQDVKSLLMNQQARDQLSMVAAKHMNPERMMRVVANAIRTTPKLGQCDPMSFLGALMHCASMGLEPNTPLGHAYLIPFENKRKGITEVQVVVGYKGFIDLARRSGQLATIHGDIVYDDDEVWSHEYGSNQHLRHRPGPRKGNRVGAYCFVKLNLGDGITAEGHRFMSMEEIIAHRNQYSQGWKTAVRFNKTADSPWNEANPAFEAMAIKTAVRALANRGELPMSIEFMAAMETDEAKANYGSFAMDPTQGVTIEGEVGEPDADPQITEDAPAQIEQTTQQRADFDERQRREPEPQSRQAAQRTQQAKPAQRRDSGAYADGAKKLDGPQEQQKPESDGQQVSMFQDDAPAAAQNFASNAWGKTFLKDVADIGFDAAYDLHASEVERVKDEAPQLWAWLNEKATEIEASAS